MKQEKDKEILNLMNLNNQNKSDISNLNNQGIELRRKQDKN